MKYKSTKKAIKEEYGIILASHNIQSLLEYKEPFAYSTRAEGWACDYYDIDGVCICAGYAPIGKQISYAISQPYEQKARSIRLNHDLSYDEQKQATNKLLAELIESVTK